MIQMTQEQRQAFQEGTPVRLRDPDLGAEVVVCPLALFEAMEHRLREFVDDEKEQQEWLETATQDFAERLEEDADD